MAPALCCRACGERPLHAILSLGEMPLANALLTADQLGTLEPRFPLDLARCPGCSLVQITETVSPTTLFGDYPYFSSYSDTMVRHAEDLVARLIPERRLGAKSLVAEIASNDGYLLQHYVRAGVPVLGVEPARNVARVANERGIPTVCEFFGEALATELVSRHGQADVIHAHNVLAHVYDPGDVVRGIGTLLRPDGVAVIEVPYLRDLVERTEFDTIYHEHLCYFSVTTLDRLFRRHGLMLQDVERIPIHGGSLRVRVTIAGQVGASVRRLLAEEAVWGVHGDRPLLGFKSRVEALKADLLELLARLRAQGKRLAAYGAAAKGCTLLNYVGLGRDTLEFVADRSPHKQGRYVPGVRVPVVPAARLLEDMPDYVLLLTWNLAEEILAQEAEYRRRGGRFIIPVPTPRVVV